MDENYMPPKDGDFLMGKWGAFIFNGKYIHLPYWEYNQLTCCHEIHNRMLPCGYGGIYNDGHFITSAVCKCYTDIEHPRQATMRERNRLHAAMRKAGYMWDKTNKKLVNLKSQIIQKYECK